MTESSILVTWRLDTNDADGFWMQRSPNGGANWVYIAALPADARDHMDRELKAGTTYSYRIQAFRNTGVSSWSGMASAKTLSEAPPTALPSATPSNIATATATATPTWTPTPEPTATETPRPSATHTGEPSATPTSEPTATQTEPPTATETSEATDTPEPSATSTTLPTATETSEPTATHTVEPTATRTIEPSATRTPEATDTNTPKPSASHTSVPSATHTPESSATPTTEPATPTPSTTDTPEPAATSLPTGLVAPSDLSVENEASASLTLRWTDMASSESGFWIQRSPNGETEWRYIAVVRQNAEHYVNSNLILGEHYFYRLSAFNSESSTDWSNVAGAFAGTGSASSPNATSTATTTPTLTATAAATLTATPDATRVPPPTVTPPSPSPVPSETLDPSAPALETPTSSASNTPVPTDTPTATVTVSATKTPTSAPSETPLPSPSPSATPVSPSATASPTSLPTETPGPPTPAPEEVDAQVFEEERVAGRLTGSYLYTWENDGLSQAIRERYSDGLRSQRTSYLEHIWRVVLPERERSVLYVNAWSRASSDNEHFVLDISFDGVTYVQMLDLTARQDESGIQAIPLPTGSRGTLHIRVRDSDQTPGQQVLDTVYVDHLFVRGTGMVMSPAPDGSSRVFAEAF
jgi:hypothetical protein